MNFKKIISKEMIPLKQKIETWEEVHKSIDDIKIKYEEKICKIEKDSMISSDEKRKNIADLEKNLEELSILKNEVTKNEVNEIKKRNYLTLFTLVFVSIILLITLFFNLKNNNKIKDIIYFTVSFNFIFSIIAYCIWGHISKFKAFFKIINVNILVLGLGFIYNNLIFSYFGIDIIYYLTIKDYLISVYQIILIILYFGLCVFISLVFSIKIEKILENINIKNNLLKKIVKILPVLSYFIMAIMFMVINELFLLKPLNLSGVSMRKPQITGFVITLSTYTLTFAFFKIFTNNNKSNDEKMMLLIFSINLIINIAFMDLYSFLDNNEELLKTKLSYIEYENKFIYKIKSTENYDFYISKPENKILVFKRNLKILEFK